MKIFKQKFSLLHLVMITILLILLKVTVSAMYNYVAASHSAKEHAALAVTVMNHSRIAIEKDRGNFTNLKATLEKIRHFQLSYRLIKIHYSDHLPADAVTIKMDTEFLPDALFDGLVNQLYENGKLSIAVKVNPKDWVVISSKSDNKNQWLIPLLLLGVGAVIIIFIWISFFSYYHHSLPTELFNFITQEKRQNKQKNSSVIDRLSDQIKQFYDEKNIMLTGLSHDIRTPLTEAMLKLELLEDEESAKSILVNLNDINSIIKTSLEYSKDHADVNFEDHDVLKIINNIAQGFDAVSFSIDVNADAAKIIWPIEAALFRRLIMNLLTNAKKYAQAAAINITHDQSTLTITLQDNGPGVPDDALPKLGTPYFRVDQSRSKQTGGTGLGLAIARKVCQLHNGNIRFENGQKGGLLVRVTIKQNV